LVYWFVGLLVCCMWKVLSYCVWVYFFFFLSSWMSFGQNVFTLALQSRYFEVLRNYQAFLVHKKLHCTSFTFQPISDTQWMFRFSGKTNQTHEYRYFEGIMTNITNPMTIQQSNLHPFYDCFSFQFLFPSVLLSNFSSIYCILDGEKKTGSWYIVQDPRRQITFGMVTDVQNKTVMKEIDFKMRDYYPNVMFQTVFQNCSFTIP